MGNKRYVYDTIFPCKSQEYLENKTKCIGMFFEKQKTASPKGQAVILRVHYFLQVAGENSTSMGNNSKRPANISKISTNLDGMEKNEKFPVGPT